jgi:hypothetical protein
MIGSTSGNLAIFFLVRKTVSLDTKTSVTIVARTVHNGHSSLNISSNLSMGILAAMTHVIYRSLASLRLSRYVEYLAFVLWYCHGATWMS